MPARAIIIAAAICLAGPAAASAGTFVPPAATDMGGATPAAAYGPLAPGIGYPGALDAGNRVDWYSFYARPNSEVEVTVTPDPSVCGVGTADDCYVYAELRTVTRGSIVRPGRNQACGEDTGTQETPLECVPAQAGAGGGVYYVEVYADIDGHPGAYTLTVSGPGISATNPVPCEQARRAVSADRRALRRARTSQRVRAARGRLAAALKAQAADCP